MIGALFKNEARLVWKHGFVASYAVVTVVYAALIRTLPVDWADAILPVLAWSDPVFFGFFFVGASVCLDLSQGTFHALFAGPVKAYEYVAAKAGVLSLVSLASSVAIAVSSRGFSFDPLPLFAAAFSGTFLSGGIGMVMALLLRTINRFMIGAIPAMLLLSLPIISYFGFVSDTAALFLIGASPSDGILTLCRAAFSSAYPTSCMIMTQACAFAAWVTLVYLIALPPLIMKARSH